MVRRRQRTNTLPLYLLLVVLFVVYITLQSITFISYLAAVVLLRNGRARPVLRIGNA